MTEEEAVAMMREINTNDPEQAHIEADDILVQFVKELGYEWLAESFSAAKDVIGFWYS